ncbi:MAG: prolyl oligopeptidase family serine peptidase [Armatimonadota bacterium]
MPRFPLTVFAIILHTAISITLASATQNGVVAGSPQTVWYRSDVDGSLQGYGVYVPRVSPGADGYPAVLHTHGYGWRVSTSFSEWQRQWAHTHGWVLINLNARGPQFYEGIGEVATLEVVRDATARFDLDPDRLYITGASMGGTGAFRHGVRHPYIFAAAVGVDGWTDFRLWHHHWYARKDARASIEEFRRPLLESCSPLYWVERARWGAVKAVVDGRDTTVWPDNGLQLHAALTNLSYDSRGKYDTDITLNYEKGHGGGSDLKAAYQFFKGRHRLRHPENFHCRTYLLKHGRMYYSRIEGFKQFGFPASLIADADGSTITILSENVSRFSLHLLGTPAAGSDEVAVYADGINIYSGPPEGGDNGTIIVEALQDHHGETVGWVPVPDDSSSVCKTADISGPIGEVFTRPFMVVYGTAGSREMTELHRREARDFAHGWNDFMIREGATHGETVRAYPEDVISDAAIRNHGIVLFGTKETSRLLAKAYRKGDIPVTVGEDYVMVADHTGSRTYHGDNFGCFLCYPNPLADNTQYLLVARGQWYTKPDGEKPVGLEYDMEKLPWAYPDYVIFNTNQDQLPHVLNVNNKPAVTCYEAAYFCEAGFFDSHWRPSPATTLDRALQQQNDIRFIHVQEISASGDAVRVKIADAGAKPFAEARVSVSWDDATLSGLTGADGSVTFTAPDGCVAENAHVVGVMGTGAVYDFRADRSRRADAPAADFWISAPQVNSTEQGNTYFAINASVTNRSPATRTVRIAPRTHNTGSLWTPEAEIVQVDPGQTRQVRFRWYPHDIPAGRYLLALRAAVGGSHQPPGAERYLERAVAVEAGVPPTSSFTMDEITADDITTQDVPRIAATVMNQGQAPGEAVMHCSIIPGGKNRGDLEGRTRYLDRQKVRVDGLGNAQLTWKPPAAFEALPAGEYEAVVYSQECPRLTRRASFMVRKPDIRAIRGD